MPALNPNASWQLQLTMEQGECFPWCKPHLGYGAPQICAYGLAGLCRGPGTGLASTSAQGGGWMVLQGLLNAVGILHCRIKQQHSWKMFHPMDHLLCPPNTTRWCSSHVQSVISCLRHDSDSWASEGFVMP